MISDGNNSRSFIVCWKLAEARHHGENVCVVLCKLLDKRAGQQKERQHAPHHMSGDDGTSCCCCCCFINIKADPDTHKGTMRSQRKRREILKREAPAVDAYNMWRWLSLISRFRSKWWCSTPTSFWWMDFLFFLYGPPPPLLMTHCDLCRLIIPFSSCLLQHRKKKTLWISLSVSFGNSQASKYIIVCVCIHIGNAPSVLYLESSADFFVWTFSFFFIRRDLMIFRFFLFFFYFVPSVCFFIRRNVYTHIAVQYATL